MRPKYLITGWARGGLGYVVDQLKAGGLDAGTTVDQTLTADNLAERLSRAHEYEVASFLTPFLGHPALRGIPVLFVMRDPMRVLNSLYFHGMFHSEKSSPVHQAAQRHIPEPMRRLQGCPAQLAVSYLHHWVMLALQQQPELPILRVEAGPVAMFKQLGLSVDPKLRFCAPETHSSYCKQTLLPRQLPAGSRDIMLNLLRKYGYLESAWVPRGGHAHYVNPDWHC